MASVVAGVLVSGSGMDGNFDQYNHSCACSSLKVRETVAGMTSIFGTETSKISGGYMQINPKAHSFHHKCTHVTK